MNFLPRFRQTTIANSTIDLWMRLSWLGLITIVLTGCGGPERRADSGLWDFGALSRTPAATFGGTTGLVQEVFYDGEMQNGKPTRVFAYLGRPAGQSVDRLPAMVLVHGGGGKAFKAWAEHWASRGYVALAMDLAGNGPAGRLLDGGPDQSDQIKFRNFSESQAREMWTYHAVAAVIRGHSLLRSLPEVDRDRVGITGISWGGYLTCIVAGLDSRFKVAVPVYGCGFLGDNSYWKDKSLAAMTPDARARWLRLFDPGQYLHTVGCPILFVNGTTDFAYPLDSYQKSYRAVSPKLRHVSVTVNRPHGHIWTFPEVDAFVDSALMKGPPLVRVGRPNIAGNRFVAALDRTNQLREVAFCYSTNSGPWRQRNWHSVPARLDARQLTGELPATRPIVGFLTMKDEQGRSVSSEHIELTE